MGTRQSGRGRASGGDNVVRVQAEIRDSVEQERLKRYTREYKQSVETEEALAALGKFSYQPVDYEPAVIRKQWVEPAQPDLSYIMTEARMKAANKYFANIVAQLAAGLLFVILSLVFMDSLVTIIGIAGLAVCALSLNRELQSRRREIDRALAEARMVIDARMKEMQESIDKARQQFEEAEDFRIERIERLLNAEPGAIVNRAEEVLQNYKLPFYLRCIADLYDMELVLTLNLPGHNVIPNQIVTLSPQGNIDYEEKTAIEINNQYSEALAGAAVSIALLLYSYIPPLDVVYIRGLFDRWGNQEYYFCLRLTRQAAMEIIEAPSALDAFQQLGARYEIGTSGTFNPLEEPLLPGWWNAAPKEEIRTAKVTIPSKF